MTISVSERIVTTASRLEALRGARGAAALDGEPFDAAEYAALEGELEALRDAEGEAVRRQRETASKARGARRGELKASIEAQERLRIEAITEAEEHARAMVAATKRAIEANERIHVAVHELTGKGAMGFQPIGFENRLSALLAAVVRGITPGPRGNRFGFINWPTTMRRERDVWAIEEGKIVKVDLAQALK